MKEEQALVKVDRKTFPAIQLGYLVALAVIFGVSGVLLIAIATLRRRRKIRGLVGEHDFIDR